MRHAIVLVPLLGLVLAGCHKGEDKSAAPAPEPATTVAPATTAPAKAMSPSQDMTGLVAKLRYEAAHRPGNSVTVEQVFDALDKNGVTLLKKRQYAGFTVKASYCAGGTTAAGVPISICEYPDAAAATAGKVWFDKELASNGVRATKGSTLINAGNAPGPEVDKALAVFNTL